MLKRHTPTSTLLSRTLLALALLSLVATHAFANGVTSLMLLPAAHLVILNLFIGIVEGGALASTGTRSRRAIPIMILANYFSAWIGLLYLYPIYGLLRETLFKDDPFFNPYALLATMSFISLVGSVICELPFVLWAAKRSSATRRRTLIAYGVAQLTTHTLVSILYFSVSNLSLLGGMRHEPNPATLSSNLQGWVYYVSAERDELRRIRLDGTVDEMVRDGLVDANIYGLRLYWLPADDGISWNLHIRDETPILSGVRGRPGLYYNHDSGPPVSPNNEAADLRDPGLRAWTVSVYPVGEHGLLIGPPDMHDRIRRSIGFGIPFESWWAQTATVLPGNLIIAGFNDFSERKDGRIILIDPDGNRIAPLVRGRGPVVMLDE